MNNKIYRQTDSRWGSLPYPTKAYSFSGNGCGCCACLHVLIEQDKYKNWTPKDLRPYMVNQGFATKGNGTTWNGITKTLEHYGNTVINHSTMDGIFKTLDERKKKGLPCLGVILFRAGTKGGIKWTAGGHYVAFVDYKKANGKHYFYTKDSGTRRHDGWYAYETTMKGLIPQIWSALPKGATTTTTTKTTTTTTTTTPTTLTVDGKFGTKSVKALQHVLKVSETGAIRKQLSSLKKYHIAFDGTVYYGEGGSPTILALQKMLKLKNPDGQFGPNTIKALQKFLNLSNPDGYFGPNTAKALQKWINTGKVEAPKTTTTTKKTTTTTTKTTTTSKNAKILQVAKSYSGSSKKATTTYKNASKSVYGKGNDTNCHRFVGTVLYKSGCPKMPISGKTATAWKNILAYLDKNATLVKTAEPGDLYVWWKGGNHYHAFIVSGKGKKIEAAHNKTYPHATTYNVKTKHKKDWIYRMK